LTSSALKIRVSSLPIDCIFLDKSAYWRRIMFQLLRIFHPPMLLCHPVRPITVILGLAFFALSGCQSLPGQGAGLGGPGQNDGDVTASAPTAANKSAELQTKLGIGYLRAGELEIAFKRLTRALQADPNFSTAHNAMGALQERLGNTDSAERHYRTAIELSPTDSSAQTNFGTFLCRSGRYDEGEQRFLQALKNSLYARPEVAYNNAGLCMQTAGRQEKAETYFRAALERNPRIPAALLGMSKISFEMQRFLPARAYLQRYQELSELSPAVLWLGVRVERELGDQASANRYAMRLRRQFPDSHEARALEPTQ
jgi:type IV pilus assembly protein PilF